MKRNLISVLLFVFSTVACHSTTKVDFPTEMPVIPITLSGEIAARKSELSGMCWYNDNLILLPQYPSRFSENGATGALFYINKAELRDFINGNRGSILPRRIDLYYEGLTNNIDEFEGFESICFQDNQVFMTIEVSGSGMKAYLIKGEIAGDLTRIDLDPTELVLIPPQSNIDNASDETMFILADKIYTVYEGNGRNVNSNPVAHVFDFDLNLMAEIPFPSIEFRITDATNSIADGSFWVINYFWPGDREAYNPATDTIAEGYGKGATHSQSQSIERLVKMKVTENGIFLYDTAPIQLKLIGENNSRNWEGIAKFDNEGFLICTDYFPETILGFVQFTDW